MIVYIVVGVVMLAGLVVAYRTLGGAAATEVDAGAVMRAALRTGLAVAQEIEGSRPAAGSSWRRRLDAQAQQLARVDVATLDEAHADAHALLAVAIDELGWAARMCVADIYAASQGAQLAVTALRDHALACMREAGPALKESGVAKEGERSR